MNTPMNRHRRRALQGLATTLSLPLVGCSTGVSMSTTSLEDTIAEAFVYAFPLYEMARTRWNALDNPANPARPPNARANVPVHRRALTDHRSRAVTTPNNDTLYSSCWIDLSAGPVRLQVAQLPAGRYWSGALMDFFTNHVALPGSRLDGRGPVQATLVGPRWAGPLPAGRVIRAPGDDAWLLGRWLVDGPHDLPAARAMQDALTLEAPPLPAAPPRPLPSNGSDPATFLAVVNHALGRNPPPATDAALLNRYATVGLRAGVTDAWAQLPPAVQQAWATRIGPALASLRNGLLGSGRRVQGWRLPDEAVGDFGSQHTLRAAVALGGLAALPPVEAVYLMRDSDQAGAPLDGGRRYRLRIPAGGVPCDAFWSLTMYQREPDGRLFFIDNPIGRYAVGDRTPGMVRGADGSMDLWLQPDAPTDPAARANWLPSRAGPVAVSLRAYLPRAELRQGRAALPTVERLG